MSWRDCGNRAGARESNTAGEVTQRVVASSVAAPLVNFITFSNLPTPKSTPRPSAPTTHTAG